MNKWMDDLRFSILFNSVSFISGRWATDNERPCAIEPHLRGETYFRRPQSPPAGHRLIAYMTFKAGRGGFSHLIQTII